MILLQSQKRGDTMNELYNTGKDIKALIESLTPEEKKLYRRERARMRRKARRDAAKAAKAEAEKSV